MIWTLLRFLLIFQGAAAIGLSLVAVYYYMKVHWVDRKDSPVPAHVVLISISHTMLILYAVNDMWKRLLFHSFTWRLPWLGVAFIAADVALILISRYEFRRYRASLASYEARRAAALKKYLP